MARKKSKYLQELSVYVVAFLTQGYHAATLIKFQPQFHLKPALVLQFQL